MYGKTWRHLRAQQGQITTVLERTLARRLRNTLWLTVLVREKIKQPRELWKTWIFSLRKHLPLTYLGHGDNHTQAREQRVTLRHSGLIYKGDPAQLPELPKQLLGFQCVWPSNPAVKVGTKLKGMIETFRPFSTLLSHDCAYPMHALWAASCYTSQWDQERAGLELFHWTTRGYEHMEYCHKSKQKIFVTVV